jgi:hypothetical protein
MNKEEQSLRHLPHIRVVLKNSRTSRIPLCVVFTNTLQNKTKNFDSWGDEDEGERESYLSGNSLEIDLLIFRQLNTDTKTPKL